MPNAINYYLVGTFNSWTMSNDYLFTQDSSDPNIFHLSSVTLTAGDKFKVRSESTWYSNADTWVDCRFVLDGDGNLVLIESGVYDISFYVTSAYDNHITIGLHENPPTPGVSIPESSFYDIKIVDNRDYYTIIVGSISFDVGKASQNGA